MLHIDNLRTEAAPWNRNDVFIEVNRFSQNGRLRLMLDSEGVFTVRRTEEVGLQSFK